MLTTILRQTAESESFRYIVERRHLTQAADEIERLTAAIHRIDMTLRVPAAEYVPAIGDVFTIIDQLKLPTRPASAFDQAAGQTQGEA